ncbi:MAG: 4-(cytidine 5'-diphospho)-2-C-methyl-D-erythritol kinase [Gemmatimonadetes bacterium]|nr:4-(cytidine 5'-diphospho)-2-C-methyl-D-erythritol kinase [Gemmatimonadota bacterium]
MTDAVRVSAHAKVNLFLRIMAREASGFHAIETLFTLLELADEITVARTADGVEIDVTGGDTGPPDDNLAVRAARAVLEATGARFGVKIALEKRIPIRAGLGGGSSDAAATLHAVNLLADNAIPRGEILQFAAKLGSDTTFFASGAAMALGWNRGERLFAVPSPPAAPALLVIPDFGVSTAEAFRLWDRMQGPPTPRGSIVLDMDALGGWGSIGRLGGNDFESVVATKHPEIRTLLSRAAETGPLLARMSGSGSAIFGVYRDEGAMEDAATMLGAAGHTLIRTQTRPSPAPGPVAAPGEHP